MTQYKIKVLLFGNLAEALNKSDIQVPLTGNTTTLKLRILEEYPILTKYTFAMALNKSVVQNERAIQPGDEVALLPPFSGG